MNKLLKLSENHYIVVDDSEIKKGDFVYYKSVNKSLNPPKNGIYIVEKITDKIIQFYNNDGVVDISSCKKITHSTEPLEQYYGAIDGNIPFVYHKIKPLSLVECQDIEFDEQGKIKLI